MLTFGQAAKWHGHTTPEHLLCPLAIFCPKWRLSYWWTSCNEEQVMSCFVGKMAQENQVEVLSRRGTRLLSDIWISALNQHSCVHMRHMYLAVLSHVFTFKLDCHSASRAVLLCTCASFSCWQTNLLVQGLTLNVTFLMKGLCIVNSWMLILKFIITKIVVWHLHWVNVTMTFPCSSSYFCTGVFCSHMLSPLCAFISSSRFILETPSWLHLLAYKDKLN